MSSDLVLCLCREEKREPIWGKEREMRRAAERIEENVWWCDRHWSFVHKKKYQARKLLLKNTFYFFFLNVARCRSGWPFYELNRGIQLFTVPLHLHFISRSSLRSANTFQMNGHFLFIRMTSWFNYWLIFIFIQPLWWTFFKFFFS